MRVTIIALLLICCASTLALGQACYCHTCYFDYFTCGGYISSHCGGSPGCSADCTCNIVAPPGTRFLESKNPGLLTAQTGGKLVVVAVLRESPARLAGIEVGDVILSINQKMPRTGCFSDWSGGAQKTDVAIQRGTKMMKLELSLVSLGSLLKSRSMFFSSKTSSSQPFELHGPFTFGFRWETHEGQLSVAQILEGSPADSAGLEIGDRILHLRGAASEGAGVIANLSALEDGDATTQVTLEVEREGIHRWVTVRSRGISQIVMSRGVNGPPHHVETARADAVSQ